MSLTPISPHTLSNRSLSLPISAVVEIRTAIPRPATVLSVDGELLRDLDQGEIISVMAVREQRLRSLAIVPLSSKGKVLGTLFTSAYGDREFSEPDIQLLTSIGHQIGVAIDNARFFEAEHRRAEQFRVIAEVGQRITSIL